MICIKRLKENGIVCPFSRRCAKRVTAGILSAVLLALCCPISLAAEPDEAAPLAPEALAHMTDEQIAAILRHGPTPR